ncbi:hypothetical protein [Mycobacteroides abscessus]|uniref:hypothetical protein n=1 Tax=Mycobacteroides abscessus TaxID=36809 RepID=UPI0009C78C15|nr:hypothetical protein [Mycobacteroides abscessus]SKF64295.1 MCE associated membrane protein [Mycobacteroides abscessus subsp. bolletii]SKH03456.1 MCE associated membrane protein [Mycobacteroides abscessus subsp. bolletii]SKH08925.1 MCE associated membrane protein [Mycobacteroides abscessus subsp. bolletii]SKH57429.1 MCE associated membrane protein [Mycobacteroides abscessus subsp. bolletii]SKH96382.1 MCE associated membrane protein [Mycobacteroides abscessus subsp. bolletii]
MTTTSSGDLSGNADESSPKTTEIGPDDESIEPSAKESNATVDELESPEVDSAGAATADVSRSAAHVGYRRKIAAAVAFGVLPLSAMACGAAAGYLKWDGERSRLAYRASLESVEAARDNTIAMLSYQPDTAEKTLTAAADRLNGAFREQYTKLVNDVVIPGARQKKIATLVNIPSAASVSASPEHAVALIFVNQEVTIGNDPPKNTASTVKVTLDKVGNRWLTTSFDPL